MADNEQQMPESVFEVFEFVKGNHACLVQGCGICTTVQTAEKKVAALVTGFNQREKATDELEKILVHS